MSAPTMPLPSATELSSFAGAWLSRLPARVRPTHLADAYPRIVNRLALCWGDVGLTAHVLDGLLVDDRGGRRGFPSEITVELLRLHAWSERRGAMTDEESNLPSTKAWDDHMQAPTDR